MIDQEIVRKVQLTQLDIIKKIDVVCKKHKIKYYLCAGSVLGAVRHNGFIPWDDDLDIMLPRNEYSKLLNILNTELPKEYWLQSYSTDEHYWQPFAKVRKLGTVYKEKGMEEFEDSRCGIWIDIFPMDYAGAKGSFQLKLKRYWVKMISFTLRVREFHLKNNSFSRRYVPSIMLLRCFPSTFLKKLQENIMFGNRQKAINYVNLASTYEIEKETYPIEWFECEIIYPFETERLPVPKEYNNYLKQLYGDYMQLPPMEKRVGHNMSGFCKILV